MGSLIPLPSFEAWETDQIKLQANGDVVTLKYLRATVILTNGNWWQDDTRATSFPYFKRACSAQQKVSFQIVLITVNAN